MTTEKVEQSNSCLNVDELACDAAVTASCFLENSLRTAWDELEKIGIDDAERKAPALAASVMLSTSIVYLAECLAIGCEIIAGGQKEIARQIAAATAAKVSDDGKGKSC